MSQKRSIFEEVGDSPAQKPAAQPGLIDKGNKGARGMIRAWLVVLFVMVAAMIIVGGFDSSNTTNLARISQKFLPDRTYHVDSVNLIRPEWLEGVSHLGVGGGTSTPKEQIQAVQQRVTELFDGHVSYRREDRDGDLVKDDFGEDDEI